ncbi:DUF1643 domain-containing protein [Virgibacillus sp. DJP39]|uniref:DUF1643 domain-containing protein n=1 Tax=Virgibacillus sp. DJP39 TaxID=3409790 RepID=UPI003BB535CC
MVDTDCVVFGWGELKRSQVDRANEVIGLVPNEKQFCIKKTKNSKFPRHPLFLSGDLKPTSWL